MKRTPGFELGQSRDTVFEGFDLRAKFGNRIAAGRGEAVFESLKTTLIALVIDLSRADVLGSSLS